MSPHPAGGGRPRTRRAQVQENDARIVQAAGAICARDGWLSLSPLRVASESGLSRTAVQARYQDDVDLAVAVWQQYALAPVTTVLHGTLAAAELLTTADAPRTLDRALASLTANDPRLRAAAELLVLAHFQPRLAAAVDASLGQVVRDWLTPSGDAPVGQRAYLLSLSLGLLLTARRRGATRLDWTPIADRLHAGLHTPTADQTLPRIRAPHLGHDLDFGTGDQDLEALLNATLHEVGERGFDGATTKGIARSAGVTEGFLFGRYASKLALFLDVTERQQALAYAANEAFTDALATRCPPGVAEAVTIREHQRPDFARERALMMEQWRIGWHVPDVAKAQERELAAIFTAIDTAHPGRFGQDAALKHYAHAHGLGVALLPLLAPGAWKLPYWRATVPLSALGL